MNPLPIIYLIIIYGITLALRAYQMIGTHLPPGINGAYYPIQVRALLETGHLAYPDMPLIFYIEAFFVKIITQLIHSGQANTILWVVKLVDIAIPPLLIFPLFALAKKHKVATFPATILAALGGLSIFLLKDLSADFTKNAVSLMLLGTLAYQLEQKKVPLIKTFLIFLACLVTHKVGLTLGIIFIAIHYCTKNKYIQAAPPKDILLGGIVLYLAVACITSFLSRSVISLFVAGSILPSSEHYLSLAYIWTILIILVSILYHKQLRIPREKYVGILAYTTLAACLSSPFLGATYAERLWFIAILPLAIALILTTQYAGPTIRKILLTATLTYLVASVSIYLHSYKKPLLPESVYSEILAHLPQEDGMLVTAAHGIDWWIAWGTHAKVSEKGHLTTSDRTPYTTFYYVQYRPEQTLFSWFGSVEYPEKAEPMYTGTHTDIYRCSASCYTTP